MDKKLMSIGTTMMILKLLKEKDMYGYEMIKSLEDRSNQVFTLKEGTLYPILHNLEHDGCIASYEKTAETGRVRKFYHITETGISKLEEKTKEWNQYKEAVTAVMGGNAYGYAF